MIDLVGEGFKVAEMTAPILFGIWLMKRKEKKQIDERHEENQKKLNEIISERVFLKPHYHQETKGPLMAENIIRRTNGQ